MLKNQKMTPTIILECIQRDAEQNNLEVPKKKDLSNFLPKSLQFN